MDFVSNDDGDYEQALESISYDGLHSDEWASQYEIEELVAKKMRNDVDKNEAFDNCFYDVMDALSLNLLGEEDDAKTQNKLLTFLKKSVLNYYQEDVESDICDKRAELIESSTYDQVDYEIKYLKETGGVSF